VQLGLHTVTIFMVYMATVWVCHLHPVRRKLGMLTVRLMVQNGGTEPYDDSVYMAIMTYMALLGH
jgi:hypothetical protein